MLKRHPESPMDFERLASIATGRTSSLFRSDYEQQSEQIDSALRRARVLVIGGAGSLGTATVRLLAPRETAALHVIDQNENSLVELVRDLRGSGVGLRTHELRLLPLDFGSTVMRRFLADQPGYDFVLNFAAVKHVRSEKDVYSMLHMLATNVAKQAALLSWLDARGSPQRYFSVSTDKAANPVNFMGASKRLMEHVVLSRELRTGPRTSTSARFANVAFSDGSLLNGWLHRLEKGQPLAVPADTRRFFVSASEAGEICVLAALRCSDGQIAIPRLSEAHDLRLLQEIAVRLLEEAGYETQIYADASTAIASVERDRRTGRYPLVLTPLDTSGEKPFEEFVGADERTIEIGMSAVRAIQYPSDAREADLRSVLARLEAWLASPEAQLERTNIEDLIRAIVPGFKHSRAEAKLDDRL